MSTRTPRDLRRWSIAALAIVIAAFAAPRVRAAGPDYRQYQVPFPAPPANGTDANDSFDKRAIPALTATACGSEFQFLSQAREKQSGEDATNYVLAKMEWYGGHQNEQGVAQIHDDVCRATRTLKREDVDQAAWDLLTAGNIAAANAMFVAQFGMRCGAVPNAIPAIAGVIAAVRAEPGDAVSVDFTVTRSCLWDQLNAALFQMAVKGQMGTDGLRCMQVGKKREGDWDMSLRNLSRIVYLDRRYHQSILRTDVRDHIRNDLLTADGPPAEETYSLLGCGNTEEHTGTAQDRADDRSWVDEALDSLGDFLSWLSSLLLIILAIVLIIIAVFFPPAGVVAALLVAAAAGVVAVAAFVSTINIPETENHLFMINSSKYLNNQLIIEDLRAKGDDDDAETYEDDQEELEEWFLERLQTALSEEFIEYNSRPYSRLTTGAIYNLADFAIDDDVRLAARMALDYSLAKAFVGSHEARRFLPFRRKREAFRKSMIDPIDPNKTTGLFDQGELADPYMAFGLLYSGQTQQLSGGGFTGGRVSFAAAATMVPATTSFYRPEPFVVDLAIQKPAIYQRFKYDSAEVYSSGPGFLISAGGVTSGLAYTGSGIQAVDLLRGDAQDDLGAALPTTIFLSGAPDHTTLDSLIRIEGTREDDDKFRTYDHNLCVWNGFACGLNIVVPDAFDSCGDPAPPPAQTEWRFIDTADCPAFSGGPRRFIVIYRQMCRSTQTGCKSNFGFVEVTEAGTEPLPAFIARTVAANPPGFIVPIAAGGGGGGSLPMSGTYHSARNQNIQFTADAHQLDSDLWGIDSVNGTKSADLDDWDFAEGDTLSGLPAVFTADGDGRVVITNPATGQKLELDLSDEDNPKRKVS